MARSEANALKTRYSKPAPAKPDSATAAATDISDPHDVALADAMGRHDTERGDMNKRHMEELVMLSKRRMEQQMPENDGTTKVVNGKDD